MIARLHHIGIGVKDLEAELRFYRDLLGIQMEAALDWEALGLRAALLKVGDVHIELIQPVAPQGEIAENLAQVTAARNGCVHHLAFEVDDLDATVAAFGEQGFQVVLGATSRLPGARWVLVDTMGVFGFSVELRNRLPE